MANWIAPLADGDTLTEAHYEAVTTQHFNYPIGADPVNCNNVGFANVGALAGVTSLTFSGTPLSGITTLAMAGALSGVTSLAMGGALSGVTTLAMTGALTGASSISAAYGRISGTHCAIEMMQTSLIGYRLALNNNGTWHLRYTPDAFATESVIFGTTAAGAATFVNGKFGLNNTAPTFYFDGATSALGNLTGNAVEMFRLKVSHSGGNSDFLQLMAYRTTNGTTWTTGRLDLGRVVDASIKASLFFEGEDAGFNFGGGVERFRFLSTGVVHLRAASVAPGTPASTTGYLYVESGALKWRGASGTVTTIGAA